MSAINTLPEYYATEDKIQLLEQYSPDVFCNMILQRSLWTCGVGKPFTEMDFNIDTCADQNEIRGSYHDLRGVVDNFIRYGGAKKTKWAECVRVYKSILLPQKGLRYKPYELLDLMCHLALLLCIIILDQHKAFAA